MSAQRIVFWDTEGPLKQRDIDTLHFYNEWETRRENNEGTSGPWNPVSAELVHVEQVIPKPYRISRTREVQNESEPMDETRELRKSPDKSEESQRRTSRQLKGTRQQIRNHGIAKHVHTQ
jgi:hypothetical protein